MPTGKSLTAIADLEEPPVGDGQAEATVLPGPVGNGTAVRASVPLFWFIAAGDGVGDSFQSFSAGFPKSLLGFPNLFAAFLVDVVGCVGFLSVGLPPGGDPLVESIGVIAVAALWPAWLPVEHVAVDVIGGVLLGGVVADGPAVGRVVAQGEFQGADRQSAQPM